MKCSLCFVFILSCLLQLAPTMSIDRQNAGCIQNGRSFLVGETWIAENLRFSCLATGPVATACVTDTKTIIGPGEQQAANGMLHRCIKRVEDGQLVYMTQICGAQVQCLSDSI